MIETGIDVRVKIQDIVTSQLPEFILSEAPLTDDFLKQFYVSQEFQGGTMDFAANLDQYLNLDLLTAETVNDNFFLTENLDPEDTIVYVNTTKSFPNEWGLLKVDNEIMTYTGVTTNTFTGVVRGFSGITSYRTPDNPSQLVFEQTLAAPHKEDASVQNLSTLFLKEFYNKIKFTFAPGFENLEFDSQIDAGTWIRQARSFYQSKGSTESFKILFKVLYGEEPTVIDLELYLIKPSEAEYSRRDYATALPVNGNPIDLQGKNVFQDGSPEIFGAVSEIEPFTRDNQLYYKLFFFVSNDEIENEKKLFTVPGITEAQRPWFPGQTTVTVDSTLGFRDNNTFITEDGTVFNYEERTVNQFLGVTCESPNKTIATTERIIDNITVSGTADNGEVIRLRLLGVISDIDFGDNAPFSTIGENIRVDSLGENILAPIANRDEPSFAEIVANSFIYNTKVRFQVENLSGTTFTLKAPYLDKSSINVGDTVDILLRGSQNAFVSDRLVTEVDFVNSTVTVNDSFGVPTNQDLDLRRNQKYASSSKTKIDYGNDAVLSNVLNLYDAREYDSNFYVATNSLPSYELDVSIVEDTITGISTLNFEGFNSFQGTYSTLIFDQPVEFITGDLVTYSVQPGIGTTAVYPICPVGEYYVEVTAPRKIRLYLSPSFIGSNNFVGLTANELPGTHIFTLESQKDREIDSQRTYRTIPLTGERQNIAIDRTPAEVTAGKIAILTNGVEIISYRSADNVFLGPIVNVAPVAGGEGYSVTSPPKIIAAPPDIQLIGGVGAGITPTTAVLTPVIKGKLEKILVDPQIFDINEAFTITVTGGNSRGATAEPQVERRSRSIPFDSRLDIFGGGINAVEETIQFLVPHNLPKGEPIVYNNRGEPSIGVGQPGGGNISFGNVLSNGGIYYADPVNNLTIRLFGSLEDLEIGTNPIGFTTNLTGFGIQDFNTVARNTIIGANIVEDGGNFWYRSLHTQPSNIFVEYDEVRYPKHGFETGELVEYVATEIPIVGLSTLNSYFVIAKSEDMFQLADAGIGGTITDNFDRGEIVNFTTVGVGTHTFKYPDIKVNINVSFASTITGVVTATPFIRGEIDQIYVDDGGYYGSDVLNFQKNPKITAQIGSGARVKPIVIEGKVTGVQILNRGVNYPDNPDVVVMDSSESGQGAVLRAQVLDGSIDEIIIISEGIDYNPNTTDIEIVDPGRDAILTPRIRNLEVNLQERFGFESLIDNSYAVVSYERTIRENVYDDLGIIHSPIIGWANDGNPIYGGFAYDNPEDPNSEIRAMSTAYVLDAEAVPGRPSLTKYPAGFFVEDYRYTGEGDLDTYNGRYGRTPEFPNGVYAYFAGISTEIDLERAPQFPYFIGPEYRDAPIDTPDIDQDFNLNDKPIYRNTFPYYVGSPVAGSEFLVQSYLSDIQDTVVESVNPGKVDGIDIVGAGASYRVGDLPIFDNSQGVLSSVVSEVEGKEVVSIASSQTSYTKSETKLIRLNNNFVRVYVEPTHDYLNQDLVVLSGLTTSLSRLNGPSRVFVDTRNMTLASLIPPTLIETVEDIFVNSLNESVAPGTLITIGAPDNTETVEVLNVFPNNRGLRIYRSNSTGFGQSHLIGEKIDVIPYYFDIKATTEDFRSEIDELYYFNPEQTIGFGVTAGQQIPVDYFIGNTKYELSIPTQCIFAPSHKFRNNEVVTLTKPPTSLPLQVRDTDNNLINLPPIGDSVDVFVANIGKDLVGIRTDPNAQPVFFTTPVGSNFRYNLETNRFAESVSLDRIRALVTTKEPHQLNKDDVVDVVVKSQQNSGVGSNPTIIVEFDEVSQSLIIDPLYATPADINVPDSLVVIPDHDYSLGEYVLYTTNGTVIAGLETFQKYYVVPFDSDSFRLAETFEDIKPGQERTIRFTSAGIGSHKFSKVNPRLPITIENNVEFDVSSLTLLDKTLNFYYDQDLTEIFDNNGVDEAFVVTGISTEGLPDARKLVRYSANNPDVIYYGLEIGGYISTADTNARSYNSIDYTSSVYTARRAVEIETLTSFTYTLLEKPERAFYDALTNDLSYTTSSATALGGVGKINIISSDETFTTPPEFITIDSELGETASLRSQSDNIGTIANFRIQNPGWGYSADNTLRPKGNIQPKITFSDSDFVTSVDIVFGGSGYQNPPNTVLVDTVTREVVDNGSIIAEVQSSSISDVVVELAPTGLSKNPHELYTINNSNGIPIIEILDIDQNLGIVTYRMQTPIQGYATLPFEAGDRVFVENVIPADNFTGPLNLNSDEYGYSFFEVVGVKTTARIEVAVQYPEEAKNNIGIANTFQGAFSSIVNKKLYPLFNVNQATAIFIEGERLSVFDEQGNLIETDLVVEESNTNFFKIAGNYDILPGDRLKGNVSGVIITITAIDFNECRYEVSSTSRIDTGWADNIGFLNDDLQVTPDNDYYQNLSYSIKSEQVFEEWIGPVNRLVHPSGLKNFADTKIESIGRVGLGSTATDNIVIDIIGLTDVAGTPLRVDRINCFDLGYDNEVFNNRSNAIRFNSKTPNKRLTPYIEVRTNRVLLVDDISNQFIDQDNVRQEGPSNGEYVDFNIINSSYTRAVLLARNPFSDQAQLTEVIGLTFNNNAYTLQKASVADNGPGYGNLDAFALQSTEYTYRYTPNNTEDFDLDLKLLTNEFTFVGDPIKQNIGDISLSGITTSISSTEEIYASTPNNASVVLYIEVTELDGTPNYYEVYAFNIGVDSYIATYGFNGNPQENFNNDPVVEFSARRAGTTIRIDATPVNGAQVLLTTRSLEFRISPDPNNNVNPYRFIRSSLQPGQERSINLINTTATGTNAAPIDIATFDKDLYQAARTVVYLSGPDFGAIHQVMFVNSADQTYTNSYPFITEGDGLQGPGIGTFGAEIVGTDWTLQFYPDTNIPGQIEINAYHELFYREYDEINYRDLPLVYAETEENYFLERYIAPQGNRTNVTRFPIKYQGVPIYEKEFEPVEVISSRTGNPSDPQNVFNINDHFFSPAEELYYEPGSSIEGAPIARLNILPVVDYKGDTVIEMPDRVWCIKLDLNRFQVAATEADAEALNFITVTGFGQGNAHKFGMRKKLQKSVFTIDGVLQSPIAFADINFFLGASVGIAQSYFELTGIGTVRAGDILLSNDEYVIIKNVGFSTTPTGPISNIGTFPLIEVERGALGTISTSHNVGAGLSLYRGSYNLVDSDIIFTEAPSGRGEFAINQSNLVEINSTFQGRVFLQKEYDIIDVYDDISNQFDGIQNTFTLTSLGSTVGFGKTFGEVENGSGLLLINDIYQTPSTFNNEGNDYFYTYDAPTGINSVTFTGITSENGQRVESEFDVNQNQIPRGGLIVSLGSTPGLGYAPLYPAIITPIVTNGVITGIETSNTIGLTTAVRYAEYNNLTGEIAVTIAGEPDPLGSNPVTDATYFNEAGILLVETQSTLAALGIEEGSTVVLDGLIFQCEVFPNLPQNKIYPDKNNTYVVTAITGTRTFSIDIGSNGRVHTYISGGTVTKYGSIDIGPAPGVTPEFAYIAGLGFTCPPGSGITTSIFPDTTDYLPVVRQLNAATYVLQAGISTIQHFYSGGGVIGKYTLNNVGSGYNHVVPINVFEEGHTGSEAQIIGIPGDGGELSFQIGFGGTGYANPTVTAPSPVYANLPVTGVFRRKSGFGTDVGKNLFVTCEVGAATTTAIGRSEYFQVRNWQITNQGYAFEEGDRMTVVGLVTAKGLAQPIEEFELSVVKVFDDNFSAWNFGQLDYLDSIAALQNGSRTRFPIVYDGRTLSFEKDPNDEDSAAIDMNALLLIFVNTVLQVPGLNYTFEGGTTFEFTSPPQPEDKIDCYFYLGKRGVDANDVIDVDESIKPGDVLQIRKNDSIDPSKTQNLRTVTELASSDTARTNVYVGNNDLDTINPRPVAWDKQKRDKIIYGEPVTKDRDILEPIIIPHGNIIRSVGVLDSLIRMDTTELFKYEATFGAVQSNLRARAFEAKIPGISGSPFSPVYYSQFEEANLRANVNAQGEVTSITIVDNGFGYPQQGTTVKIGAPADGERAVATTVLINPTNGEISNIFILPQDYGSGYDPANPPPVIVKGPAFIHENFKKVVAVEGFSGIITGMSNITSGFNGIRFFIEVDDPSANIPSLGSGDSVVITGTFLGNPGSGVDALPIAGGLPIGVGTQFVDCVYEITNVSFLGKRGRFDTRVTSSPLPGTVSGENLGYFSWGRLTVEREDEDRLVFNVDGATYSQGMEEYPTVVRSNEGLRNEGGLAKRV